METVKELVSFLDKEAVKVNPWAICYSVGLNKKKDPKRFERCVQDVKKKNNIKR